MLDQQKFQDKLDSGTEVAGVAVAPVVSLTCQVKGLSQRRPFVWDVSPEVNNESGPSRKWVPNRELRVLFWEGLLQEAGGPARRGQGADVRKVGPFPLCSSPWQWRSRLTETSSTPHRSWACPHPPLYTTHPLDSLPHRLSHLLWAAASD